MFVLRCFFVARMGKKYLLLLSILGFIGKFAGVLMENKNKSLNKGAKNRMLIPGFVSEVAFDLLIELSSVHSIKIINALHDYLVLGDDRKIACERYGANSSYFSIALGRLLRTNQIVSQLASYYGEQERFF